MLLYHEGQKLEQILRHLGLWEIRKHDPPKSAIFDPVPELIDDFSDSQIPSEDIFQALDHLFIFC